MTVIKDGTGQGFLAEVNINNQLSTRSVIITEISFSSEMGNAFQVDGETTIVAGSERTILILINNDDEPIQLERIFLSAKNQTGIITTVKIYVGTATVTGGGTTKTPKNLNTTSTNLLNVTVSDSNPTIGGTDVRIQEQYFLLNDTVINEYSGAIVLGRNGSVRITCTGAAGATGTFTCDAAILYFQNRE